MAGCSSVLTLVFIVSLCWIHVISQCTTACSSAPGCDHLHNRNSGYCASSYYDQVSQQSSRYTSENYEQGYSTSCGFLGWDRCGRTRTLSRARLVYYTSYRSERRCSQSCCSGYTGTAPSNCRPVCAQTCSNGGTCSAPNTCSCTAQWSGISCTTPVCSISCQNGGTCTSPNTCACTSGWTGAGCLTAICTPACANGGACTSPGVCSCASGWSGSRCTDPVCSPGCSNGGTCTAPNTCSCTPQWTGATCTSDVNECETGAHNCQQRCVNEIGTFSCDCNSGYELASNGYQCNNIDECVRNTHDCSQRCVDTVGSFNCECNTGYRLQGRTECVDINECDSNPCDHTCTNNVGSFTCGCNEGYRLQGDTTCVDIDECTENDPCDQDCANTVGSFTCSCRSGYELDQDGLTCNDIDECQTDQNDCSQNCENTIGGHYCFCDPGYLLSADGVSCAEFELTAALSTPPIPANLDFLNSIKDGLAECVSGSICTCINNIFTALSNLGFTQGTVQTTGESFSVVLSTTEQQAISDLILAIFGPDSSIALPVVANIKEMAYNCTNQEFYVETFQAGGELEIFPGIMTLSMVGLQVRVSSVWSSPMLESIQLRGTFGFGTVSFDTLVETNDPDVWTFGAALIVDGSTEINIIEIIASAIDVDLPHEPLGSLLTITDVSLKGLVDIASNFEYLLVLQGTIHISDWYEETVCIIIQQSLSKAGRLGPQMGLVTGCVEAEKISFATLIDEITGFDVSSFGFFDSFELPAFHIVYTTPNFTLDAPRLSLIGFSDFEFGLDVDFTGFRFIFDFYLDRLKAFKPWVFYTGVGPVKFRPVSFDLDGFSLTDMVTTLSSALSLPSVDLLSSNLNGFLLRDMNLDLNLKELVLSIEIPEEITIFIDSFRVSGLAIAFNISLDEGITFNTFSIAGMFKLGGSTFDVAISYDDGEYEFSACAQDFDAGFAGIASAIGSSIDSSLAVSTFGFGDIGLFDPCFAMKFRVGQFPVYMCFSADLFRGEFADVGISACVTQEKKWVFGFEIREFIIGKLLAEIIGSAGRQISFFNQKLYTAVIIAPIAIDDLPLQGVLLEQIDNIVKGTTIIATSEWPEGCASDPFCTVARGLLGEDLNIFIIIQLIDSLVSVEARVENFQMGSFTLSAASIQMMFGPGLFSLGIAAEMEISNPPITLIGAFRLRFPQAIVSMEMAMKGCWPNAFGISILDMCDFFISVSILPGSPLPGVAFGVTVKIGDEQCYVLEATGFFGINPNDPTDNYFYVGVGPLTFQRVLDLFCVNLQLPSFLGNTGFPEGFMTSYAAKTIFLPHADLTINQGFYFKGTISIFGLSVESEIILDPPELIDVYARLSPLTVGGGLLKLYESREVTNRGPFLHVIVQSNPQRFEATASGYVSVLGIEAEAILTVSDDGYEISVYGNIFGVLEAELYIKASIGNVLDASYRVAGRISSNILQRIQDAVVGVIQDAGQAADKAISGAQDRVRDAEVVFDRAVAAFNPAIEALQSARSKVSSTRRRIRGLRDDLCEFKSCGSICVPLLCPCGCAARAFGACVLPCLKWSNCCFRIPDPICVLYNIGCAIIRAVVLIALAIAEALLVVVQAALVVAEGVVRGLQLVVDQARFVLDAAIAILEAIKQTIAVGLAALEAITKFLLTGIINITEMGFDLQIAAFSHGSISVYMDVSFLGQSPVHLSLNLPIYNPLALVADLADRAVPGLGRKKRSMKKLQKVLMLANHFKHTGSIYPSSRPLM